VIALPTLRRWHRGLALVLGAFLALHLGNHLIGVWGQDRHFAMQETLRVVYRHPLVEPIILAGFALQVGIGLTLLARRRKLTLQTVAGAWLALFLMAHVGVVLLARWQGTDTTLAFAAAGLHAAPPWPVFFALYYGLAVLAVFVHLSVPLGRWQGRWAARGALGLGTLLALVLVLLLAGALTPLSIPEALIAAFP
jgi:hypothetical protein